MSETEPKKKIIRSKKVKEEKEEDVKPEKKVITKKEKKDKKEDEKKEEDKKKEDEKKEEDKKKEDKKKEEDKKKDKKEIVNIQPLKLASFIPDFLSILTSFFLVNHKYVALQEIEGGKVIPTFFIVLEKWDTTENVLQCQFYKHTTSEKNEEGAIHVKPLWDEPLVKQAVTVSTIWNCLPFDETRDYNYI
jgi:archaellum component FlaD/FlaE